MDVYRYVPPKLIEIKIAAPACSVQVPTLALTRLHVFGKASTMSTPLYAVLGWFLGLRDRSQRNTPVSVVSSRTESASNLVSGFFFLLRHALREARS